MDRARVDKEVKKAMKEVEKAMSQVKLAEKQAKQARKEAKMAGKTPGAHIFTHLPSGENGAEGATFIQNSVTNYHGTHISISNAKNVQVGNNNTMIINSKSKTKSRRSEGDTDAADDDVLEQDAATATADKEELQKLPIFSTKRKLTQADIDTVCIKVSNWRRFLRFLDLEESNIEHVYEEHFHNGGVKEVLFQGIKMWQRKEARSASVDKVANALLRMDCVDGIRELQP